MPQFPYYTEPTHDQGAKGPAARDTAVSGAEGRLKIDAQDKIMLLEPTRHPLVTLLTSVGKVYDGQSWKGSGMLKRSTGNPEFSWFLA